MEENKHEKSENDVNVDTKRTPDETNEVDSGTESQQKEEIINNKSEENLTIQKSTLPKVQSIVRNELGQPFEFERKTDEDERKSSFIDNVLEKVENAITSTLNKSQSSKEIENEVVSDPNVYSTKPGWSTPPTPPTPEEYKEPSQEQEETQNEVGDLNTTLNDTSITQNDGENSFVTSRLHGIYYY